MDYDFTFLSGQSVAPVIPAILPLAESTGATPVDVRGGVHRRVRGRGADPAREPAAVERRRLAFNRRRRRDRFGGRLRQAPEGAGRQDSRRARHQRVAGERRCRQLRHHDQAAALRQRGAQRRAGGAPGGQGFTSHASAFEGTRASSTRSPAVCLSRSNRSRTSAAATTSSRSATASRPIRAAGAATPRSRPRWRCASRLAAALRVTNIHCLVSKSSATRINTQWPRRGRGREVQRRLRDRLFAGARRAAHSRVHRGSAQGRARAGGGAARDRGRRSRVQRRLRREPGASSRSRSRTGRRSSTGATTRPDRSVFR